MRLCDSDKTRIVYLLPFNRSPSNNVTPKKIDIVDFWKTSKKRFNLRKILICFSSSHAKSIDAQRTCGDISEFDQILCGNTKLSLLTPKST